MGVVSAASRGSAGWNPPLLVLPGDGLSPLGSVVHFNMPSKTVDNIPQVMSLILLLLLLYMVLFNPLTTISVRLS